MKKYILNRFLSVIVLLLISCIFISFTSIKPDKDQSQIEIDQIKLLLVQIQNEIDSIKVEYTALNDSFQVFKNQILGIEESDTTLSYFDVVIESIGDNKLSVMNTVYQITGLGLKGSKKLIDQLPSTIKNNLSEEEALLVQKRLEDAGAKVKLVPKMLKID